MEGKLQPGEELGVESSSPDKKGAPKQTVFGCFAKLCHQRTEPYRDQAGNRLGHGQARRENTVVLQMPSDRDLEGKEQQNPESQSDGQPENSVGNGCPLNVIREHQGEKIFQGLSGVLSAAGISVHQLGECQTQGVCQWLQCIDVGKAQSGFPNLKR